MCYLHGLCLLFLYSGGMCNSYLSCTRRVSHALLELWFLKLRQSLPLRLPIVPFIYGRLFFHQLVEVSPKFSGLSQIVNFHKFYRYLSWFALVLHIWFYWQCQRRGTRQFMKWQHHSSKLFPKSIYLGSCYGFETTIIKSFEHLSSTKISCFCNEWYSQKFSHHIKWKNFKINWKHDFSELF